MAYEKEYYDISEKILELSDELSEEIILENIKDQMSSQISVFTERVNYLSLFREKYTRITSEELTYDKDYVRNALMTVTDVVKNALRNKYGVRLGNDLDFYFPDDYLKDTETLYEFFFIRHFDNLVNYFKTKLWQDRSATAKKYESLIQDETHNRDLFVQQARKKFKNQEDVTIIHFIDEIIDDIRDGNNSAYVLFDTIIAVDPFEEYSARAGELLLNYGKGLIFDGDQKSYELYMKPLESQDVKNELRNQVLLSFLESIELSEEM